MTAVTFWCCCYGSHETGPGFLPFTSGALAFHHREATALRHRPLGFLLRKKNVLWRPKMWGWDLICSTRATSLTHFLVCLFVGGRKKDWKILEAQTTWWTDELVYPLLLVGSVLIDPFSWASVQATNWESFFGLELWDLGNLVVAFAAAAKIDEGPSSRVVCFSTFQTARLSQGFSHLQTV